MLFDILESQNGVFLSLALAGIFALLGLARWFGAKNKADRVAGGSAIIVCIILALGLLFIATGSPWHLKSESASSLLGYVLIGGAVVLLVINAFVNVVRPLGNKTLRRK